MRRQGPQAGSGRRAAPLEPQVLHHGRGAHYAHEQFLLQQAARSQVQRHHCRPPQIVIGRGEAVARQVRPRIAAAPQALARHLVEAQFLECFGERPRKSGVSRHRFQIGELAAGASRTNRPTGIQPAPVQFTRRKLPHEIAKSAPPHPGQCGAARFQRHLVRRRTHRRQHLHPALGVVSPHKLYGLAVQFGLSAHGSLKFPA